MVGLLFGAVVVVAVVVVGKVGGGWLLLRVVVTAELEKECGFWVLLWKEEISTP